MPCTELPIYWGPSASSSLNAAAVQALANSRDQTTKLGTFECGVVSAGNYAWFALPQSFGQVASFVFGDGPLNVVYNESEITLTVDGSSVDYYLYRSPDTTVGEVTLRIN